MRTSPLTLLAMLSLMAAGCTPAQYRIPDELEGHTLVPLADDESPDGLWSPRGMVWTLTTPKRSTGRFELRHEDGREASGICRRTLRDPQQSWWTARQQHYQVECVVTGEDGAELARLLVWWLDDVEQEAEAIALGEVLTLRSGGDTLWRLPGGVSGYDIEHGGEAIGVIAFVGDTGLHLRDDTPPRVRSATSITHTLLLMAYQVDRAATHRTTSFDVDVSMK